MDFRIVRAGIAVGAAAVLTGCSAVSAGTVAPSAATTSPAPSAAGASGPRSVIFINGDGMSTAARTAGRLFLAGQDGQLQMDQLSYGGFLTTDPHDPSAAVTDSAAGATAWATGQKTYNGAISVDVDKKPLPTIGQDAKAAGKATGLVTTAQVTDASPAAFFSQTPDRGQQDEIARQYLEVSKPDVILGGGEDWWLPAGSPGAFPDSDDQKSKGTKGDLIAEAQKDGYDYVSSADGLAAATGPKLLGLFADEEQFQHKPEGQGDSYDPVVDLATMTQKALDTLDRSDDGFFLFVEEEGVDEFEHANNGEKMLLSMKRLDAAVGVARAYIAQHPDTLLVVAADHETGGLAVENAGGDDESGDGVSAEDGPFPIAGSSVTFALDWTTGEHTGAAVPVTAQGPGAEKFSGQHPNTFVHEVVGDALGS
jgi:alkaline phosphatase